MRLLNKENPILGGGMLTQDAIINRDHLHTFQQLRADIHKLHLLPQVSLVQLPNTGDEGVFFSGAAGYPPIYLLKVEVKLRIFLYGGRVAS